MGAVAPRGSPRLLDAVRARLRFKHYSLEQAYIGWIRRFILANDKRHPREMGASEVERFLSDLAERRAVTASTQIQALSAMLFRRLQLVEQTAQAGILVHIPAAISAARIIATRKRPVASVRHGSEGDLGAARSASVSRLGNMSKLVRTSEAANHHQHPGRYC